MASNKSLSIKERYNAWVRSEVDVVDLKQKNQKYPRNVFKKSKELSAPTLIKYAIKNEHTARIMETTNTLVFIVSVNATKPQIKAAVEELYGSKVVKVNTLIVFKRHEKKAFVRFAEEGAAVAIAEREGIL